MNQRLLSGVLACCAALSLSACGPKASNQDAAEKAAKAAKNQHKKIEAALDLSRMKDCRWRYDEKDDAWVMATVCAVKKPKVKEEQSVSVCVPGAYIKGLDTDGDGKSDVNKVAAAKFTAGTPVVNQEAEITSKNGQIYTAKTAPVLIETGQSAGETEEAAGDYGAKEAKEADCDYTGEGYVSVACGNRGMQSPLGLVDIKNAIRFISYNIQLGNLPGDAGCIVTAGGSYAALAAMTADSPDFYDYEIAAGAVGIYKDEDGRYNTRVTIHDKKRTISDGAWGCVADSPTLPLDGAEMALAFECYLDKSFDFASDYQKKLAEYLSKQYMNYINDQNLFIREDYVDLDINDDTDRHDRIRLEIEYDKKKYKKTRGFGGSFVDFATKMAGEDEILRTLPDSDAASSEEGATARKEAYRDYMDMIFAYEDDIQEIEDAGRREKNIVDLYDPLFYIDKKDTTAPVWVCIRMDEARGEVPLLPSLNLQAKLTDADDETDCMVDWLGEDIAKAKSLPLLVDQMYGSHVKGAVKIEDPEEKEDQEKKKNKKSKKDSKQTSKDKKQEKKTAAPVTREMPSMPAFDPEEYGGAAPIFGSNKKEARHWDKTLLGVLKEQQETLEPLWEKQKK